MTKDDVVALLKDGADLANRGDGWWLSPPRKPYKSTNSVKVADDIVDALVADNTIKIEIPFNSAKAVLVAE